MVRRAALVLALVLAAPGARSEGTATPAKAKVTPAKAAARPAPAKPATSKAVPAKATPAKAPGKPAPAKQRVKPSSPPPSRGSDAPSAAAGLDLVPLVPLAPLVPAEPAPAAQPPPAPPPTAAADAPAGDGMQLVPLVPLAPAPEARPPAAQAEAPLSLPPLPAIDLPTPPAESAPPILKLTSRTGVLVLPAAGVDRAATSAIEAGLRSIAELAPLAVEPLVLAAPACDVAVESCLASHGAAAEVDHVLVAEVAPGAVRVRSVDVATARQSGDARTGELSGALELQAAAEALACRLLVPAGCSGSAAIEAEPAIGLAVDGRALEPAKGPRRVVELPVGLHPVRASLGAKSADAKLAVVRKPPRDAALQARAEAGGVVWVRPGVPALAPAPAIALAATGSATAPAPSSRPRWTRPAGIALAAAGVLAVGIGAAQGASSRSHLDRAEASFRSRGGAYAQSDLPDVQAGNAAASRANVLFVAGGLAAAAGAVLTFAF